MYELLPASFQPFVVLTPEQAAVKATADKFNWYCDRCNRVMPKAEFLGDRGKLAGGRHRFCADCDGIRIRWMHVGWSRRKRLKTAGYVPINRRAPVIPPKLRFQILERDGFACRYCGRKAPQYEIVVDHILPRCHGGLTEPNNLVAACSECNGGKGKVRLCTAIKPVPIASYQSLGSLAIQP